MTDAQPDGGGKSRPTLNGWMIVVIVLILAAAAVSIAALVTRGPGTTKAAHGAAANSSTSTTTAPIMTTAPPTTVTAPPTSSIMTYSTGQANDGWPTYDLFTGNCSSVVATYQYAWMGLISAPTPITVPAGEVVQLGGSQTSDTTITVTAAPSTMSLPAGLPFPQSDQAGVLVAGHDGLIGYKCG